VIEDAAQSFGAKYKGRSSCNLSTIGCTSFFPSKPLGCYGDGGACFTNDEALADSMRQLRNHGQDRRYHHVQIGINGRLDTLQAAILLAKLEVFEHELARRNEVAAEYSRALEGEAVVPFIESYNVSAWAQYTVKLSNPGGIQAQLQRKGIPTAIHYPAPVHLQPAFTHLEVAPGSVPVAEEVSGTVLSLPMHPYLDMNDIRRVSDALLEALRETNAGMAVNIFN
jgi:UDP-2-acetamido-2-deoxy-ribo-hexuluronate aminotransferase